MSNLFLTRAKASITRSLVAAAIAFSSTSCFRYDTGYVMKNPVPSIQSADLIIKVTNLSDEEIAKKFEPLSYALSAEGAPSEKLEKALLRLRKLTLYEITRLDGPAKIKFIQTVAFARDIIGYFIRLSDPLTRARLTPQLDGFSDEFFKVTYGGNNREESLQNYAIGIKQDVDSLSQPDLIGIMQLATAMAAMQTAIALIQQLPKRGRLDMFKPQIDPSPYKTLMLSFFKILEEVVNANADVEGI